MLGDTVTEEMVLQKERQNAARRNELIKRQSEVGRSSEPPPNFPPECCCIKPVIYHNIRVQVPVPYQRFMYILCGLYLTIIALIIYNIVAALVNFIFGGSAMHFGLSFLYLLGLPGAWICWYYNVYCAIVYSSRPRQLIGLFGLFFGIGFDAWMAIGLNGYGGCGWIITISRNKNMISFILLIIASILWTLHGLLLFVMFCRFWRVSNRLVARRSNIYTENIL